MARLEIDSALVERVARLARLELTEAEADRLKTELAEIVDYVGQLDELDTSTVSPTTQVSESGTPMREDEAQPDPAGAEILAGAPEREDRFFKVPRIVE